MKNQTKFNTNFQIGFGTDLIAMMNLMQEATQRHTHAAPGLSDYYDEHNCVWILTHWQVEISRYPLSGEMVNITTWPVGFKGFFGERGFEIADSGGARLLAANSNWLLLDRANLRPKRPDAEIAGRYGPLFPFLIEKDFKIPETQGFATIGTSRYTVTRRDIDINKHTNNVKYLEWILDLIPDDVFDNGVKALKVAYKKETQRGDLLEVNLFRRDVLNGAEFVAKIVKDGLVACEIWILFGNTDAAACFGGPCGP